MVLSLGAGSAFAGGMAGPVLDVISEGDTVLFSMTDYYHSYVAPACNTRRLFAFDTKTQGGRNKLAIVLAAKNSGHHLGVDGTGTCSVLPDAESVTRVNEGMP